MGLTQTKLHFKILREKWPGVVSRLESDDSDAGGRREARTRNPLGDLPLHYACYTGRAPAYVIRALLAAYPEGAGVRNKNGFLPVELAEVNYRREGPHRNEVLEALRAATQIARAQASARAAREGLSPREAEMIRSGGVPEEVYRTSSDCVVCLDRPATEVAVPCGHLCLCADCAVQVRARRVCPVGRCFVGNIVSVGDAGAAADGGEGSAHGGSGTGSGSRGGNESSFAGEIDEMDESEVGRRRVSITSAAPPSSAAAVLAC